MIVRSGIAALLLALSCGTSAAAARPVSNSIEKQHMLDRVAIDDVLSTYLYRLDHGQADRLPELFSDDGVMDVENVGALKGHQAIADYYSKRSKTRTTRHVITNLYIEFVDRDHAKTVHTLTYFMGEGAGPFPATPLGVADYSNNLVRAKDGKWRIAYRKPTPVFGFRPGAPAK
jgi:hypothetical protein